MTTLRLPTFQILLLVFFVRGAPGIVSNTGRPPSTHSRQGRTDGALRRFGGLAVPSCASGTPFRAAIRRSAAGVGVGSNYISRGDSWRGSPHEVLASLAERVPLGEEFSVGRMPAVAHRLRDLYYLHPD